MSGDQAKTIREAIEHLIEESRKRPIIPFLGSGMSYASGYPTVRGVIEYLAKLDVAIQFDIYKHRYPQFSDNRLYKEHPAHFIEDFGWPSIGELNADLWNWLGYPDDKDSEGRKRFSEEIDPQSIGYSLKIDIVGDEAGRKLELRDHLRAIVQWSLRRVLADKESGTRRAARAEWDRWKDYYLDGILVQDQEPWILYGDWDEMLYRMCEGNLDLVDSLFMSFERGRYPTLAHRYLAFLIDKLSIPLVFTTNFDSFLERAMHEEGVLHRPFDVHRDAALPHESLVARQTSVLKLHGSAYGLRVGERLKYPAEAQALDSIVKYIPEEPLFLVSGFSGSERRMIQILKTLATSERLGKRFPRMLWLEGPGVRCEMLSQFAREVGENVCFTAISDISTFLQQVFFNFAGGYQASSTAYSALPGRPAFSAQRENLKTLKEAKERKYRLERNRCPVQVFSTKIRNSSWAGLAVAKFAAEKAAEGYNVIWIDLEKHHTVAGTVSDILQKARQYDPDSPNFTLIINLEPSTIPPNTEAIAPEDVGNDPLFKAADRVHDVLKQGRYVLVLDSIESYGRPQFQHHGIPSFRLETLAASKMKWYGIKGNNVKEDHEEFTRRVGDLFKFLNYLIDPQDLQSNSSRDYKKHIFHDSFVCLSLDDPVDRHDKERSSEGATPLTRVSVGERSQLMTSLEMLTTALDKLRKKLKAKKAIPYVHFQVQPGGGRSYNDLGIDSEGNKLKTSAEPLNRKAEHGFSTSEDRLKSFFKLKHDLQKIQQCPNAIERSHHVGSLSRDTAGARSAFLGMLSVFRRARSIACIRAMTERWGIGVCGLEDYASAAQIRSIRLAIDGLIRKQIVLGRDLGESLPFGMLHEGGSVWLFRDVQVEMYGSMTESLSVSEWVNHGFLPHGKTRMTDKRILCTLIDGLIGVSLHTEASRVYYADTFMPTHDLDSFYEYLYHRCWAIRTLSLLIGILTHKTIGKKSFDALRKRFCDIYKSVFCTQQATFEDALHSLSIHLPLSNQKRDSPEPIKVQVGGTSEVKAVESRSAFLELLRDLRLHCLTTLNGAFHRQKRFLRMSVTADTLRGWVQQIELVVMPELDGSLFGENQNPNTKEKENTKSFWSQKGILKQLLKELKDRIERVERRAEDRSGTIRLFGDEDKENVSEAERKAKKCQTGACFLWAGLDLEESVRPWIDENRAHRLIELCREQDEHKRKDEQKRKEAERDDIVGKVNVSRTAALDYEYALRQSTRDSYEDARHRSCALALLARSEYLRGHFRQAQHRLDLASGGISNSPVHCVSRSLICTYRAELLVYSADDHYDQLLSTPSHGKVNWLDVSKELRKIVRAEKEVRTALQLMGVAENLTRWRCLAHLGYAQVQLERLLFESEQIFARRKTISHRQFATKFGMFEQMLLSGLRNLRSTLDLLPYLRLDWKKADEDALKWSGGGSKHYFEYKVECKVWSLWRQFYVAASYCEGILNVFWKLYDSRSVSEITREPIELLSMIEQEAVKQGRRRWQHWNLSVRFDELSRAGETAEKGSKSNPPELPRLEMSLESIRSETNASLRKLQTAVMLNDLKYGRNKVVKSMWDFRRRINTNNE